MKRITYSEHAREQMEHRFISREYVKQAIDSPISVKEGKNGRKEAIADLRGRQLKVIYGEGVKELVVITAYWLDD